MKEFDPPRPFGSVRQTIYLQPFGNISGESCPKIEVLVKLCETYYLGLKVVVRDSYKLSKAKSKSKSKVITHVTTPDGIFDIKTRKAPEGSHQQLSLNDLGDVLLWKLPADAWCVIGLTMEDMFESKDDVFCMGRAWGQSRIGVVSFLRYDPDCKFGAGKDDSVGRFDKTKSTYKADVITYRAGKTLVHELGHCFGLDHCIEYKCIMNACKDMNDDLSTPYHMCPFDVQKLHYSCQFDVKQQYAALYALFQSHAFFRDEAEFVKNVVKNF
jgi:archaemetzincin